jgi:hypothetical protein
MRNKTIAERVKLDRIEKLLLLAWAVSLGLMLPLSVYAPFEIYILDAFLCFLLLSLRMLYHYKFKRKASKVM